MPVDQHDVAQPIRIPALPEIGPDLPRTGHFKGGTQVAPDGERFSVNARWFERDGRPWYPVMGEIHFSRIPVGEWDAVLRRAKAGGVGVVATYVFWIHHEEVQGRWEWSGQRNLGAFLRRCAHFGLKVWLRIGPWCHGEVRNGGLPDWLATVCTPRSMDPAYFVEVDRLYREIHRQVDGQLHPQGGPIIGVQLENEFGHCGGEGGEPHIIELKRLARAIGYDVPYYSVTGWGGAWVPEDEALPMQGAYADNFWDRRTDRLPPPTEQLISDLSHLIGHTSVGSDRAAAGERSWRYDPSRYPYSTAELGGGMSQSWHRRPTMDPKDALALAIARLAEGANGLGWYMYAGGTNPEDSVTSLQENDFNQSPVMTYDFQAPIGEFARAQGPYHHLRLLHQFLDQWGAGLVRMRCHPQRDPVTTPSDPRLRLGLRSDGRSGFLFLSNHQRYVDLPDHHGVRFTVELAGETLSFPATPATIPRGTLAILPLNLALEDARLVYGLAQPFAQWDGHLVLTAIDGTAPELRLDGIRTCAGQPVAGGSLVLVPELGVPLVIETLAGRRIELLVLTQALAFASHVLVLEGRHRLVTCAGADLWQDQADRIGLTTRSEQALPIAIHPELTAVLGGCSEGAVAIEPLVPPRFQGQVCEVPAIAQRYDLPAAGPLRAWRIERAVAQWPTDQWPASFGLPLTIRYVGDLARLYLNGRLVADHFWHGPAWEVDLARWRDELLAPGASLVLVVAPWKRSQAVFVDQVPALTGELTAELTGLSACWSRTLRLTAGERSAARSGRMQAV